MDGKIAAGAGGEDRDLSVVFASGATIVAVGDDLNGGEDALIVTSNDRGATWVQIATPNIPSANGEDINDGIFVTSSIAIAVGDNEEILRSVDRGASWTEVGTGITGENLNAVTNSGVTVVAVGDDAGPETIIRSVDSGATWALATTLPNTGSDLNDVQFITPTIVIAVGDRVGVNEVILRSTDGGDTWTDESIVLPDDRDLNAIAFSGAAVVTVGDEDGGGGGLRPSSSARISAPAGIGQA